MAKFTPYYSTLLSKFGPLNSHNPPNNNLIINLNSCSCIYFSVMNISLLSYLSLWVAESMSSVPTEKPSRSGVHREAKEKGYTWIGEWDLESKENFYLDLWGTSSASEPEPESEPNPKPEMTGNSPEYHQKESKPPSAGNLSSTVRSEVVEVDHIDDHYYLTSPVGNVGLGIKLSTQGASASCHSDLDLTGQLTMDLMFFRQMYYEETFRHNRTRAALDEMKNEYAFLQFRYQEILAQLELQKLKGRAEKLNQETSGRIDRRVYSQLKKSVIPTVYNMGSKTG